MPDITQAGELIVWPDELCAACKKNTLKKCPLISVLDSYGLVFTTGCRVWECKLYDPDVASEHYIPEMGSSERADRQIQQLVKSLTLQVENLLKVK